MLEGEEGIELRAYLKERMTENFPNLVKEIDIQVQEVQRVPNTMNPDRTTPRHIVIKMPKLRDNERILKEATEKQLVTFRGALMRLSADFSTEMFQARKDWHKIFKVIKSNDLQPRLPSKAIV